MKNYILFVAISLSLAACKKENEFLTRNQEKAANTENENNHSFMPKIDKTNHGLMVMFTETWCPPAGAYGGPTFDTCIYLEGTISALEVMASSNPNTMNSTLSSFWQTQYSVTGVPTIFMNNLEQNSGGGVYTTIYVNYNWVNNKQNSFASQQVLAGIGLNTKITGNNLEVKARAQFLSSQPPSNNYSLAIYVVEDSVLATQQVTGIGSVTNFVHRNILRTGNAATYHGDSLNLGVPVSYNQLFSRSYTIPLDASWNKSHLKLIAVIWKLNGSAMPTVINSKELKKIY